MNVSAATMEKLLAIDPEMAMQDLVTYRDFFNQFGKRMPAVLLDELTNLGNRLHFAVTKVCRLACGAGFIDN